MSDKCDCGHLQSRHDRYGCTASLPGRRDAPYTYEVQPMDEPRPWNGTGVDGWVVAAAVVIREVTD